MRGSFQIRSAAADAGLIRALSEEGPGRVEVRSEGEGDAAAPVLHGHFAVFNEWTEINSLFEGHFLERVSPGAFRKTFSEQRDRIRVLLEHGMDERTGNRPLGAPRVVDEDSVGARYEVPLFHEADYVRELLPAFKAGQYGSSFRFKMLREDRDDRPARSEWNPKGIPERTLTEVAVPEFGPCVFPAYAGATSGVRSVSLTDALHPELLRAMNVDPEDLSEIAQMLVLAAEFLEDEDDPADIAVMSNVVDELVGLLQAEGQESPADEQKAKALEAVARAKDKLAPADGAGEPHPNHGSRDKQPLNGESQKETPSWRL